MQKGLLAAGMLLAGWECWRHVRQGSELAGAEAQVRAGEQELESRRSAVAAAEQRNREVVEAEERAGNERLLALMRERAAATKSASEAAAKTRTFGNALAGVLDSPDQQQAEKNYMRDQMRANLDLFFKLTKLSPEKAGQYVDEEVEMKRRQDERMSALLDGTLSVADAVRQRDQDNQAQQDQRRELLGPDGWAVLQSIADGMRNDSAKNLTGAVQANMGNNPLTQEQSEQLQSVFKAQVAANTMDDTDLFRPLDEWTQMVTDQQQHVLQAAAEFLTPVQMETFKGLVALNLAQLQAQRAQRSQALGIKNGAQN